MATELTNNQVLLNEYIKQEYDENSEYAGREDDFFEFFAASQVLKDFALSDEEIENGICGNDKIAKGTDFIVSLKNQLSQFFTKEDEMNHAGSI
jgi:hypothetical protein